MSCRATAMLTALLVLASGCTPSGFLVNGRTVTDQELLVHQGSWRVDSTAATSKSLILPDHRQKILNLIAHQEATGATTAGECSSLTLIDVVPLRATHLRLSAEHTFGPVNFAEHWRVLSCGNKHNWIVLEERGSRRQPTAVYMKGPSGEWAQFQPAPTQQ